MKIKSIYDDPFTGKETFIHDEEDNRPTISRIRELFELYPEIYRITFESDLPFVLYYDRLPPEEKEEKENKDSSVVYPEFSSEEDEEEITKQEYGNWWD